MDKKINADIRWELSPRTITIVTTHQCTASCRSCCFACSPKRELGLKTEEMIRLIKISTETFSSIQNLVLTGGEVMTLGMDNITQIIRSAKDLGLVTRIVTNAVWAYNKKRAERIVTELAHAGLDEINFSTGDEHQRFVPFRNILNAIAVVDQTPEIKTCAVVLESGNGKKFVAEQFNREFTAFFGSDYKSKLVLLSSPWVDLQDRPIPFDKTELIPRDTEYHRRGCDNIFNGLQINPRGQLLACCGFAAEYTPLLKMGRFPSTGDELRSLIATHTQDLLKIWLYLDGPKAILEYLEEGKTCHEHLHDCEICTRLLLNPRYLAQIADLSLDKITDILYRFEFRLNNLNS